MGKIFFLPIISDKGVTARIYKGFLKLEEPNLQRGKDLNIHFFKKILFRAPA